MTPPLHSSTMSGIEMQQQQQSQQQQQRSSTNLAISRTSLKQSQVIEQLQNTTDPTESQLYGTLIKALPTPSLITP